MAAAPIPEPMLARSGPLPGRGRWIAELKLDGFRCLVRTGRSPRIRSRNGWEMTKLLPELTRPELGELVLAGELVAFNAAGVPHFPDVCRRMLHRDHNVAIAYCVFDLLTIDGTSLVDRVWQDRRHLLEALELPPPMHICDVFEDGDALFDAVCKRGLEGVVFKRVDERYRPGERGWIKKKNPNWWRRGDEIEAVRRKIRRRSLTH